MSTANQLTAICDLLRTETSLSVVMGRPNEKARAIYVWPWRIQIDTVARNAPVASTGAGATRSVPFQPVDIRFLLIATPTLGQKGLDGLDLARQVLIDHPIITTPDAQLRVTPDLGLPVADLAALFIAAKLTLTPCAEFLLRSSAAQP